MDTKHQKLVELGFSASSTKISGFLQTTVFSQNALRSLAGLLKLGAEPNKRL
jgi:hypothetical protein